MTMTETPSRQRTAAHEANKHAATFLRPYVGQFAEWNRRAAHSNALLLSNHLDAEAKLAQRTDLGSLRAEVTAGYRAFKAAAVGQPHHSRLDDVEAAFARLLRGLGS